MAASSIYDRNNVLPYEHRGKAIRSLATKQPPAITELVLALSIEQDMALRKCIVRELLMVTKSTDVRELRYSLASISASLPTEDDLNEIISWRLPY